jgi:hypothetical protein
MTTTISKLPTLVLDPEYAIALAREIRDYTGADETAAREEVSSLVRSGEMGTFDHLMAKLRTALRRRMRDRYLDARLDAPVTEQDIAKLPRREVPIIRDPDCAAFAERKLAPLKGRMLERGQAGVREFVSSGFQGPFDEWARGIESAVDTAVRSKEASDG